VVILALLQAMARSRPLSEVAPFAGGTLLGVLWIGFLFAHVVLIRGFDYRGEHLYALLAAIWLGDTAAYLTGRAFGRTKLAPWISPGKTVVGLFGGLAGGVLGIIVVDWSVGLDLQRPIDAIVLGVLLGFAGVAGDLAESALKRGAGVKDSGALFPGHGGVLDRFDSLLFAAPVMYYYLVWIH
jgi:phosphatidate cytidylyltransferase